MSERVEEHKWRQGTESGPMVLSKKERMVAWMGGVTVGVGRTEGYGGNVKANAVIY